MPKLFTKKWIFSFLISFSITFVVGFFLWNIFITPGNGILNEVLGEINKIGSNLFLASFPQKESEGYLKYLANENTAAEAGLEQEEPVEQDMIEDQSPVVEASLPAQASESVQDQLDDIQEKLDIISQQVQELIAEQTHPVIRPDAPSDDGANIDDEKLEEAGLEKDDNLAESEKTVETTVCTGQININTASAEDLNKIAQVGPATAQKIILARPFYSFNDLLKVSGIGETTLQEIIQQGCAFVEPSPIVGGGSGGGAAAVYSKILISEIQIYPIAQRFIELYNPNNADINLTNWYLQRKDGNDDSWNSLVSSSKFAGKLISANSYFLISKSDETADILLDNLVLTENNSFAFKNPNGDISDKLGFGGALDFELLTTVSPSSGQSISRKWDLSNSTEQDTNNNSVDFELGLLTPRAQNIKWTEPVLPTLANIEITTAPAKLDYIVGDELDISGLVVTGNYSDGGLQSLPIILDNISGFDSATPTDAQILTITYEEKITTYTISVAQAPESVDTTPPSIITYTISELNISPNGDGIKDSTTIDLAFSEKVKANIDIVDSSGVKFKDFYTSSGVVNPEPKDWDGRDKSEVVVPDGVYTIKIIITDMAGNQFSDTSKTIAVDTIKPVITLNGDSEIILAVSSDYEEEGAIADDGSAVNITDLVDINTVGVYTMTYTAIDTAGNSATATRNITVIDNRADINNDGQIDAADYLMVKKNFSAADCSSDNSYCNGADINKDGNVDAADMRIFVTAFDT